MNEDYDKFITSKRHVVASSGFEPFNITVPLFQWQRKILEWAVRRGRCALFEDCGLGKTPQQLEWAWQAVRKTDAPVLIMAPLAVSAQTVREGAKFGIPVSVANSAEDIGQNGIYITNYEKLDKFDTSVFSGVVLDESSILKSFTGKLRQELTAAFKETPYRLCCTATPSPNDYTELGQHADFLGICSPAQMLATYFINDTFNTGDWRLKKHAEKEFWRWLASWAACISKPSDIGFSDDGYILPKMSMDVVTVDVDETANSGDELFRIPSLSATNIHKEMKFTCPQRADAVAKIVNDSTEQWLVWCNTNDEADALVARIPDAVEVRGSDTVTHKEKSMLEFADAKARVLITKPSIAGYGLNFQQCHNTAFVGLSYSFEDLYQALRRIYRFGQMREVNAVIVQARTEHAILKTIREKIKAHETMQENMKNAAREIVFAEQKTIEAKTDMTLFSGPDYTIYWGDCVRAAREMPDHSAHLSVFSPPFADLFTYSDDPQDMGNTGGMKEFMVHFDWLIAEMARVMVPGREVCVHCVDLLSTKWKHGRVEFQDFSGEIIRAFWKHGFLFHSRIAIWKSPVTEMQRTKAFGLLYKTFKSDTTNCRVGCADYLLVFRAPGENPTPVTKDPEDYPVEWWQESASPVWMTVDQGRVLNGAVARENADERHICPLQLDVIDRCIELWSNPNELVWSPFTGIGSEGWCALRKGRRFIGSELKESYARQAAHNLENAKAQMEMFS